MSSFNLLNLSFRVFSVYGSNELMLFTKGQKNVGANSEGTLNFLGNAFFTSETEFLTVSFCLMLSDMVLSFYALSFWWWLERTVDSQLSGLMRQMAGPILMDQPDQYRKNFTF